MNLFNPLKLVISLVIKQASYGLIGLDTSYSLSPLIHETAANELGISCSYKGFSLKQQQVQGFLESFLNEGGQGLNITNPYKKMVANLVGSKQGLLAVNTLVKKDGYWKGFSTDGEGFYRAFLRAGQDINSFKAICFLGVGDVVQSIMSYLATKIFVPVYFLRRKDLNDSILKNLYAKSSFLSFESKSLQKIIDSTQGKILLVQATSAPNQGDSLFSLSSGLSGFKGFYYDLIYKNPSHLYYFLQERKVPVLEGLSMLVEQALLAQKIWWGQSGSYKIIEDKIKSHG